MSSGSPANALPNQTGNVRRLDELQGQADPLRSIMRTAGVSQKTERNYV